MTKKIKLLLSSGGLIATAAIIPVAIVACGATTTDMTLEEFQKAVVISPTADATKLAPETATDVVITNDNAVEKLAALGISLTLNETPSGTTPFTISSYSIVKENVTSISVTINGTSGQAKLKTTIKVNGFKATAMTQSQVDAYATVSQTVVESPDSKTYYTPKVATNIAIINDNAISQLAKLGIKLTLGTTPNNVAPFTISSYSISAVPNSDTSISITINGTSGAAISTTAVTVKGFTATTDMDQGQIDTLITLTKIDNSLITASNGTINVTSNQAVIDGLKALGITTAFGVAPASAKDFISSSYLVQAIDGQPGKYTITIVGKSGATTLSRTVTLINTMTQAQVNEAAKIAETATTNATTPAAATDVAITNANAVAELAKLGITLTLGATPDNVAPFTISSYSISEIDATNISITISGTSGETSFTTEVKKVTGFTEGKADMNQAQVDNLINITKSVGSDVSTSSGSITANAKQTVIDGLKKLGVNATFNTTPKKVNDFMLSSYSVQAIEGKPGEFEITITGASGKTSLSKTVILENIMSQDDVNNYIQISPSAVAGTAIPETTTTTKFTNNEKPVDILKKLGINLTLGTPLTNKKPFEISSYRITQNSESSISITISGTSGTTNLTTSAVTVNEFLRIMTQYEVDKYVDIPDVQNFPQPGAINTPVTSNDEATEALGEQLIVIEFGTVPEGSAGFIASNVSITNIDSTTKTATVTITGNSGYQPFTRTQIVSWN